METEPCTKCLGVKKIPATCTCPSCVSTQIECYECLGTGVNLKRLGLGVLNNLNRVSINTNRPPIDGA